MCRILAAFFALGVFGFIEVVKSDCQSDILKCTQDYLTDAVAAGTDELKVCRAIQKQQQCFSRITTCFSLPVNPVEDAVKRLKVLQVLQQCPNIEGSFDDCMLGVQECVRDIGNPGDECSMWRERVACVDIGKCGASIRNFFSTSFQLILQNKCPGMVRNEVSECEAQYTQCLQDFGMTTADAGNDQAKICSALKRKDECLEKTPCAKSKLKPYKTAMKKMAEVYQCSGMAIGHSLGLIVLMLLFSIANSRF